MKLLIDTDVFCKLGVVGLLEQAVNLLGADLTDCGRLPALPYMLRKGTLRRAYGRGHCDTLIPIAEAVPIAVPPNKAWLEKLTPVHAIDPGEAQIFAAAAEGRLLTLSGDKRALRALKNIAGFADALEGRIVGLEAILVALCDKLGPGVVREHVEPLAGFDKLIQVCFSEGNPDPREPLLLYHQSLADEVRPLTLWHPRGGEGGGA